MCWLRFGDSPIPQSLSLDSVQSVSTPAPRAHRKRNIAIAVLLIVVLSIGIYSIGIITGLIPQQEKVSIVNGTISIKAGNYTNYQFTVPNSTKNAMVSGSFKGTGSLDDDVVVFLMTSVEFSKWKNHVQADTVYNTMEVIQAKFSVPVNASETYDLVFDNTFSLANKTFTAQFDLVYPK